MTEEELGERLTKIKALTVFSSDVMSSVAYATEASMFTLLAAGTASFYLLMPISRRDIGVLALVTISYRQTIRAYPNGGGSYIVAKANLGAVAGWSPRAALLVDYVLTVAVTVSAGVTAVASAFPVLFPIRAAHRARDRARHGRNLRGFRESGTLFAAPTYVFLGSMFLLLGSRDIGTLTGNTPHVTGVVPAPVPPETFGLLLVLRAFADGCSRNDRHGGRGNGIPHSNRRNGRTPSRRSEMSVLLGTMFLGTSYLAGVGWCATGRGGDRCSARSGGRYSE